MASLVLGIDVSKHTLHTTLLPAEGETPLWQRVYLNDPRGLTALLQVAPPDAAWVLEPTGRYHLAAVEAALATGRQVLSAEPRAARLFLRSRDPRAKTDRVDSLGLALFGRARALPAFRQRNPVVDEVHDLLAARKGLSLARARLSQQCQELHYGTAALQAGIDELSRQLRHLDAQIAALTVAGEGLAVVQRLQQVPGIGPVTAASLAARLVAGQFPRAESFVAYVGLDITVRQSGQSASRGRLSRRGDAELRRLLYLAAMAACRAKRSPFAAQYAHEKAKGLSCTAAYNAVARKLAKLAWSIYQHRTTYDPDRVYGATPPAPAPAVEPGSLSSA